MHSITGFIQILLGNAVQGRCQWNERRHKNWWSYLVASYLFQNLKSLISQKWHIFGTLLMWTLLILRFQSSIFFQHPYQCYSRFNQWKIYMNWTVSFLRHLPILVSASTNFSRSTKYSCSEYNIFKPEYLQVI